MLHNCIQQNSLTTSVLSRNNQMFFFIFRDWYTKVLQMKNMINLDTRNKITHSPLYLMITFAKLIL